MWAIHPGGLQMIQRRVLVGSAVTAVLVLAPAVAANAATTPSPSPSATATPKPSVTATVKPPTTATPKPTATATKAPTGAPNTGFGDSSGSRELALAAGGVLALAAAAAIGGVTLTRRRGQY